MPGCWSRTPLTSRRQALGDRREKVWLRKARRRLLERLALTALPCQESAEAPGPACLAFPRRLVGAPRTPPRGRPGGLGASDACAGTGGSRGDPTSVDASASPFLRPPRLWLRWRESMWPSPRVSCSPSASPFKLHSRVAGGARGGKSPPASIVLGKWLKGGQDELAVRFGLRPLRAPTCHASQASSPQVRTSGGGNLSCWFPPPFGLQILEGQGPFFNWPGVPWH